MKKLLKILLSVIFLFGAVPTVNATPAQACEMTCEMACADEVKKQKKKKGFFSKVFGSK